MESSGSVTPSCITEKEKTKTTKDLKWEDTTEIGEYATLDIDRDAKKQEVDDQEETSTELYQPENQRARERVGRIQNSEKEKF